MKFSAALITFALALSGTQAAPSVDIEQRQTPIAYVRLYQGGGCQGPWVEDTVYIQDGSGDCIVNNLAVSFQSVLVVTNELTLPLRLYTTDNCTPGNFITYTAGETGCQTQSAFGSARVGN
ncbi:hypothetical protein BS50DRAFT_630636 [Corynespora cassiicola Philippines]|uniref:Uncharacterized protein n=1 Tax=Corynespora cassiicola Philippines TaxID=1448308 RepID=A0A2T2P4R4_CORCC|nr:hypothetical protein BS50DRAFT_630636 [Corynespora cassiicola Philippines]